MAVVITQEIKKKRTMLALAGILLVVTATILYFGLKTTPPEEAAPAPAGVDGLAEEIAPAPEVGDLKIDILEDARFKKLQESPGVPVATSTAGKLNPFSE